MANVRTIRRRIRSVQNTAKVTKAMEMIAASKMRRAQQKVLSGRPYSEKMREVLADLAYQIRIEQITHPMLSSRENIRRMGMVHITPDRGLCGGLVSNVNRAAGQYISSQEVPVQSVVVGRKGRDFMARAGCDVRAVFTDLGDRPTVTDVAPIAHLVVEDYLSGHTDGVQISFSRFVTTTIQRPTVMQLLPVEPAQLTKTPAGYIYEPRAAELLEVLLPRYVELQLYQTVLEACASEQSARMVAMRNATDSAHDMIEALTLLMNKVRQETVTNELLDIVGGVAALES